MKARSFVYSKNWQTFKYVNAYYWIGSVHFHYTTIRYLSFSREYRCVFPFSVAVFAWFCFPKSNLFMHIWWWNWNNLNYYTASKQLTSNTIWLQYIFNVKIRPIVKCSEDWLWMCSVHDVFDNLSNEMRSGNRKGQHLMQFFVGI